MTIKDDPYHKKCLSCNKCGRQLDSLSLSIAPDNNVYCKVSTLFENKVSKHRGLVGKIFEIRSNNIIGKEFETSKALIIGMLQSCDSP